MWHGSGNTPNSTGAGVSRFDMTLAANLFYSRDNLVGFGNFFDTAFGHPASPGFVAIWFNGYPVTLRTAL